MSIREKGYHKWDGELKGSGITWLPMFFLGAKTAFKKKFARISFTAMSIYFLVFLAGIYISTKPELKMFPAIVRLVQWGDAAFFKTFFTFELLTFMLLILNVFIFSGSISGDLKFNAFPLYFSRPMDRKDYILGKFSVIMFYMLIFTLLPGVLLLLFKFAFTTSLSVSPRVLLGIILVPTLVSGFFAATTLAISSLSSNGRYVKIILFLVYFFSDALSDILKGIFRNTYFNLFSIWENFKQMGAYIFGTKPDFSTPGYISLGIVLGGIALSFFILFKKIGKSEAQIEIGS